MYRFVKLGLFLITAVVVLSACSGSGQTNYLC